MDVKSNDNIRSKIDKSNTMFSGVVSPVLTILDRHGKISFDDNKVLINHLIDKGVDGLLFFGSLGEFFAFTLDQKKVFIKFVIEVVNKRVPVLIGTGGTIVEEVIELSQFAEQKGADGVVVVSPYYFKLDEANLYRYYSKVASSTKLPVLIYNFPDRTNVNISPKLVLKLAEDYPNIVGIKDTLDSISHTRELIQVVKSNFLGFSIFSGFDEYLLPNLIAGGDGAICGLTNVAPELFVNLRKAFYQQDFEVLKEIQRKIGILMNLYTVSEPFVAAIKTAVAVRGLPILPFVKDPGSLLDESQIHHIKEILQRADIKTGDEGL